MTLQNEITGKSRPVFTEEHQFHPLPNGRTIFHFLWIYSTVLYRTIYKRLPYNRYMTSFETRRIPAAQCAPNTPTGVWSTGQRPTASVRGCSPGSG